MVRPRTVATDLRSRGSTHVKDKLGHDHQEKQEMEIVGDISINFLKFPLISYFHIFPFFEQPL